MLLTFIMASSCQKEETPPENPFKALEEEIDYIADKYVKVGAIIGVIDRNHNKLVFSYGSKTLNDTVPPDANTVFDIGSVTKTFTTTLMAKMYLNGDIPVDTVGYYLPSEKVTMPTFNGTYISFINLATHTSGLPRTPHADGQSYPVPAGHDPDNPYIDYTTEDVYDYLTNYCKLEFEPSTWWAYSNTGLGLLGHVLGIIDGTSYESILTRYIFEELDMGNSSLFLTEAQSDNMALGYSKNLQNKPFFIGNDIFQGCGMIKSSLNDMFKYLDAQLGISNTALKDAIELTHQPVMHQGSFGEQALCWWVLDLDDGQKIIYMAGNTYGHMAYIGFNKSKSTGAIVLLNCDSEDNAQLKMGPEILQAIMKY